MAVFDRGDIVSLPLDPAIGHEQRGTRPALVLTTKECNKLGDVLVAPITQGGDFARYAGTPKPSEIFTGAKMQAKSAEAEDPSLASCPASAQRDSRNLKPLASSTPTAPPRAPGNSLAWLLTACQRRIRPSTSGVAINPAGAHLATVEISGGLGVQHLVGGQAVVVRRCGWLWERRCGLGRTIGALGTIHLRA